MNIETNIRNWSDARLERELSVADTQEVYVTIRNEMERRHYSIDIDNSDHGLPPFNHNLVR